MTINVYETKNNHRIHEIRINRIKRKYWKFHSLRYFINPLSAITGTTDQKISKDIEDLKNTLPTT